MRGLVAQLGWFRAAAGALLVLLGTVAFSGLFVRVASGNPVAAVLALVVAVGALAVLLALPVRLLPAVALVVFAFFPAQLQPDQGVGNVLRPALVILYVWVVRRWCTPPQVGGAAPAPHPALRNVLPHAATYALGLLLVLWLWMTVGWSVIPTTSTSWTIVFVVSCFLPLLVPDARAEATALRTALLWSGAVLGAYAVAEQVLRTSPLYGAVYGALGITRDASWSVYRAEASFGHPLWAGAFFVVPATLGLVSWLQTGRTRDGVLGGAAALGTLMTVSRGSLLALGAGVAVGVVLVSLIAARPAARRLLGVLPLGLIAFAGLSVFQPLAEREDSLESGLSAGVRTRAIDIALRAAHDSDWLGSGPASSGVSGRRFDDIVIENSLLQLLISIGLPGLVLFVLLVGAACAAALARRDVAVVASLVAYAVAVTGFNSLDAVRAMHVLIGFLVLLALHGAPTPPAVRRDHRPRRAPAAGADRAPSGAARSLVKAEAQR
ncbi:hypothetical protein FHN55_17900 [Streptomyces sp. NP160]|uniref:O-antigen ligase family protein n=1 Tax=Streptomyces sp. NP160 TaxID=2586637 RepID=UPI001118D85B|nr:O-antigen ligase family protein [Streptomyces sp. NP160]TNM61082.1 hypothetical protein FHN55_17900 [Streptomyces sp. NP160]